MALNWTQKSFFVIGLIYITEIISRMFGWQAAQLVTDNILYPVETSHLQTVRLVTREFGG